MTKKNIDIEIIINKQWNITQYVVAIKENPFEEVKKRAILMFNFSMFCTSVGRLLKTGLAERVWLRIKRDFKPL